MSLPEESFTLQDKSRAKLEIITLGAYCIVRRPNQSAMSSKYIQNPLLLLLLFFDSFWILQPPHSFSLVVNKYLDKPGI